MPVLFELRFYHPDLQLALDNPTHLFWKRRRNPRLPKRTKRVIELLQEAPYTAAGSHPLRWDLSGLRAADLVGGWRLIFKVCEECRKQEMQKSSPLDCCRGETSTTDITINLLDVDDYHG